MTQSQTAGQKYKDGDKNFPILYEDEYVIIYKKDGSDEIYFANKRIEEAKIRVTAGRMGILVTFPTKGIELMSIAGKPAIGVGYKRR